MKKDNGSVEHYNRYEERSKHNREILKDLILSRIPKEKILDAVQNGEGHLNEIRLSNWDGLAEGYRGYFKSPSSLADRVCILKHIAAYHIAGALPPVIGDPTPYKIP